MAKMDVEKDELRDEPEVATSTPNTGATSTPHELETVDSPGMTDGSTISTRK
jgi:hypothetical protein